MVVSTGGLPATHSELTQPLGSKGLPMTLVYADHYDDSIGNTPVDRKVLFDTSLHQPRPTGSGTSLVVPIAPSVILTNMSGTTLAYPTSDETNHTMSPRNAGLTTNLSPPSLNHESGALEFGQIVHDVSRSHHDAGELRSSVPFARLSLSEVGRFTAYERRRYASGRPANHTFQQTKTTDDDVVGSIDMGWGAYAGSGTFNCEVPAFTQGGRVEAITHYAKADLPSNAMGVSWGDAHNATFLTTLGSAPIAQTGASSMGITVQDDDKLFSSHWNLNLGVRQPILASGTSISSPDGSPVSVSISEDADSVNLLTSVETIQSILVADRFSDGTASPTDEDNMTLGRVDLGNHTVADSCGLIGYEGVITATAFFSISKNSDPSQTQGAVSFTDDMTYAGLNIQVHSGTTVRRNGDPNKQGGYGLTPFAPYRYGSDGTSVDVMTDAITTSAHRTGSGSFSTSDANRTVFSTRRDTHYNTDATQVLPMGAGESEINADSGVFRQQSQATDRLFGDTAKAGDSWAGTQTLSSGWLSDSIPTKVQIVPQVIGYTNVQVSVGDLKLASHPSAQPITFRKPIVDYHVLVSVADRSDLVVKSDTTVGNTSTGDPTSRNDPSPNRLHANMDLSDLPCTIYHGIVRINPDTLEQIYLDPADLPAGYDAISADCPMSVMPRHRKMSVDGKVSMGWGLHQITPFRPLASRQWVRVPKLCSAIQSGGFYQRGGVSHLWDADVYGGELFVGADIIDATDFAVETTKDGKSYFGLWGNGQIVPNGSHEPAMPQGCELLIFRYSPKKDPYHPSTKNTSPSDNPIRDALGTNASAVSGTTTYSAQYKTGFTITDERLLADSAWEVHDWVIPQLELMRYLGKEEKSSMRHPKHSESDGTEVILHPTVHCSSLRIMDDGRMLMAMVHRDYIDDVSEFPSADIGYPANPDLSIGSCPVGYVYSDGQCVPITASGATADSGFHLDPTSGDEMEGSGDPQALSAGTGVQPSGDNFSQYPTWNKLIADTSARSLILAFSDAPANDNGQVARGRVGFALKWELVPVGDESTQELAIQTWTHEDTWWSGARIAYWYDESGQRAIPMTYGSYPECRMSHANLPRSLAWLDSDLNIHHGLPFRQPATMSAPHPSLPDFMGRLSPVDEWYRNRYDFLKYTRFVPTTIGFADFGAGANPFQELGWSGWSFPADLYDPISYGDGTAFFRDSTTPHAWKNMGDNQNYDATGGDYNPYSAVVYDLTGITLPATILSWNVGGVNVAENIPVVGTTVADLVSTVKSPPALYDALVDAMYLTHGGALTSSGDLMIRKFEDTPQFLPAQVFTNGVLEFGDLTLDTGETFSPTIAWSNAGRSTMLGSFSSWSYHGSLHYGLSATHHPYRVDRVFKQVHAGLGYDVPLHLLIPPEVHVRARAGGNGQIDLEMETPFHRTDYQHLIGASLFESGFELGGASPSEESQNPLGQWYLRTNLWDSPMHTTSANVSGISLFNQRIKGAIVSGSIGLEAYWTDHPTDHFHAGAMPILPNNDYDLAMIETNRYAPVMLARASEMHDLDVLATSEQLLSSVDVHVSQTAKPYWDSGAIVSAQGVGEWDNNPTGGGTYNTAMTELWLGEVINAEGGGLTGYTMSSGTTFGMGKGQRVIRTPEGTLHHFLIKRSIVSGYANQPTWAHMKKPLHSDLFWSRRATTTSPDTQTGAGADECGAKFSTLPTVYGFTTKHRVCGASFCSDSKGTIHAVIEYHLNPEDEGSHRAHSLYYHKADRVQVASSPEPVYDWDWSVHTPVLINNLVDAFTPAGTIYDFRQPSLVCDSKDRLHLTVARPMVSTQVSGWTATDPISVFYTMKEADEPSFPNPSFESTYGDSNDTLWSCVSRPTNDTSNDEMNNPANSSHIVNQPSHPKVCLRSDDVPVVFFLGYAGTSAHSGTRNKTAVYANIGEVGTGGRIQFNTGKVCHVLGLPPDSKNTNTRTDIHQYDSIIDENDRAITVGIRDDRATANGQTWASRHTLINKFNTRIPFAEQYTATDGLGDTRTLFKAPQYDGTTELRYVDTYLQEPTLTTNGKGEYHLVMRFTMTGQDEGRVGATFRDQDLLIESAVHPLQWAGTPLTGSGNTLYTGGYASVSGSPDWTGQVAGGRTPTYANGITRTHTHFMHIWFPSYEFDDDVSADDRVVRSINLRWLSVPSMRYDATLGFQPVGSAQTIAGQEDFPHLYPQIRYQRFWGYDASEIDLTWKTNELSWYRTPHYASSLYLPNLGGVAMSPAGDLGSVGMGIQGFPNGV